MKTRKRNQAGFTLLEIM
ncbi:MAG: prepilin-type N-terminal cleavage/methylation domain-containing protein, partial [Chthoniobacterales bacterium]|nr:prepilin-type N-terminal cleavage/methylation domain-containing protein [Chthoniobacterales bacterium]